MELSQYKDQQVVYWCTNQVVMKVNVGVTVFGRQVASFDHALALAKQKLSSHAHWQTRSSPYTVNKSGTRQETLVYTSISVLG